jgi:hypothetical protein
LSIPENPAKGRKDINCVRFSLLFLNPFFIRGISFCLYVSDVLESKQEKR